MHVLRKREATSLHLIATPSAPVREEDIFAMLMTAVQARRAVYNTVICKAVGSVFLWRDDHRRWRIAYRRRTRNGTKASSY